MKTAWSERLEAWCGRVAKRLRLPNYTCDVCGREVFDGARICDACLSAMPRIELCCPLCGRKVKEAGVCMECKARRLAAEKCRAVFTHEGEAARLVTRYKGGARYLREAIADLMLPVLEREFSDTDALVPVPMTDAARRRRGFDHARLIAEALSARSGKPVLSAVVKQKETAQQKTLSRREREKNLEGCFHVRDRAAVRDKTLLIIDDTLTTGATIHALAGVLLRAKAKRVCALTLTGVEQRHPFGVPSGEEPHPALP